MATFERLLGPNSLKWPKAFLVHQQVVLPIFNRGIRLIFFEVTGPIAYLGSWAIVAFTITSRFLMDSCPFLKAIGASNSRPPPSQAHLKLARKLLPLGVATCVPRFE